MNSNRSFNTASVTDASINERDLVQYLSADELTPLAFSAKTLLRRKPAYRLSAEVRSNRSLGVYVLYSIEKLGEAEQYDSAEPIYQSSCLEDIYDVWACFK